jgi:hypothetical protein
VLISTAVAIPDEVHTSFSILVWQFVYQSIASQRDASILYTLIFLTIPSPLHGILPGSIYSIRIPNCVTQPESGVKYYSLPSILNLRTCADGTL